MNIVKNAFAAALLATASLSTAAFAASHDVAGLKLGMTVEQAEAVIKGWDGAYQAQIFDAQFDYTNGQQTLKTDKFVSEIKANSTTDGYKPNYTLSFSAPPEAGKLVAIGVQNGYELGKGPSAKVMYDALVEKYGKETLDLSLTGHRRLEWFFDNADCPKDPKQGLRLVNNAPHQYAKHFEKATKSAEKCGAHLSYLFQSDPVTQSQAVLVDVTEFSRLDKATQAWLDGLEGKAKKEMEDNASKVKPVL
ncbi:MAG: hypothetical protein FJX23_04365 [Alphaproteobacteria bacterium]|nr:hypothetical protein [Alphaproteobacteria bacterium]